jgi:PHD/YefM family antitoxin component YafN of YafNO toxin-antitoxin module
MKTSTIASAKNNLPQLIYDLESEDAIHLTRHGRPVAVMLSEANYQKLTRHKNNLYSTIQQWRMVLQNDIAFTETELNSLRKASSEREFSWDS